MTKEKSTDPKDTDVVERAIGGPIGFDHAEHAVELPVDEEDDEQMVGVPKAFKVGLAPLFHRVPDDKNQTDEHYPAGDSRSSCEVHEQEVNERSSDRGGIRHGNFHEVEHVSSDVDDSPKDDRPGGSLVEGDILVERNDVVQGCLTQQGDEVPTNREQDKGDIDVEDESSSPGEGWWDGRKRS